MLRTWHRTERPGAKGRCGFSLAELLVAIAILGVGLTMAAGLFPTAMVMNQDSTRNTVGTIICENGATVARAALTHQELTGAGVAYGTWTLCGDSQIDPDLRDYLTEYQAFLGDPDPQTNEGFVVLATRAVNNAMANDYRLVIVSYRLQDPANTLVLAPLNETVEPRDDVIDLGTVSDTESRARLVGSVVFTEDGRYARIERLDEEDSNLGILDRVLSEDDVSNVTNVIWEVGSGTMAPRSPVMAVLALRTALPTGT